MLFNKTLLLGILSILFLLYTIKETEPFTNTNTNQRPYYFLNNESNNNPNNINYKLLENDQQITSNLDLPNGVISSGNFQSNGHANYNKPAVIKNEGSGDYEDDF